MIPSEEVDRWNADHPVGTAVVVRLDSGERRLTETRSPAWVLGGHTAVVLARGISGAHLLARVKALDDLRPGFPPPPGEAVRRVRFGGEPFLEPRPSGVVDGPDDVRLVVAVGRSVALAAALPVPGSGLATNLATLARRRTPEHARERFRALATAAVRRRLGSAEFVGFNEITDVPLWMARVGPPALGVA